MIGIVVIVAVYAVAVNGYLNTVMPKPKRALA